MIEITLEVQLLCGHQLIVVEVLLVGCAKVNEGDNDGFTALMLASIKGNTEVVEVLINGVANVNNRNNYGETALMFAIIKNKSKECIKLLIEAKSDLLDIFAQMKKYPK